MKDLVHVLDGIAAIKDYLFGLLNVLHEFFILFSESKVFLINWKINKLITQWFHEVLQVVNELEPIACLKLTDADVFRVN